MKVFQFIFAFILPILLIACGPNRLSSKATYIPKNLEECYIELDRMLSDSIKGEAIMKTERRFGSDFHFSLGMWLRNNWGLWQGSRLSSYFNELGIYHADDMSGIILTSYHRRLTGKDVRLEDQIKYYQDYWKVVKAPEKNLFPKGVKEIEFNSGFYYERKDGGQGFIHVGRSPDSQSIWLYDYYLGWVKVNESDVEELRRHEKDRENILLSIIKRSS